LRRKPLLTLDSVPDVLTVDQTAAVLGIGRNQAYDAIRRGQLFAVRIGRSWRVPKAALLSFLAGKGPA
jgi:excisionase family DNA binding protein